MTNQDVFSNTQSQRGRRNPKVQTREAGTPKAVPPVEEVISPKLEKVISPKLEKAIEGNSGASKLRTQEKSRGYVKVVTEKKTLGLRPKTIEHLDKISKKAKDNKKYHDGRLDNLRTLREGAIVDAMVSAVDKILESKIGANWHSKIDEAVISEQTLSDWFCDLISSNDINH